MDLLCKELRSHQSILTTRNLCMLSCFSHVQLLVTHGWEPASLLCPWDFLGKNNRVGFHVLLQGIFLIQGSNLCLLNYRWIFFFFLTAEPLGKPNRKGSAEQILKVQQLFLDPSEK